MAVRIMNGASKLRFLLVSLPTKPAPTLGALQVTRNYSSSSDNTTNNDSDVKGILDKNIKKSVFISQSYDVFTNLALEDWLYKNFDFSHHHVLMLWANDPCVVIGRHQNPFTEANISNLVRKGVTLARRNSGGGAVFHDRGNLNCTFFTPRERYNRKYNLNIITRALFREWGVKADINKRDDIVVCDKKISGTAAKLGHPNAYHHCTLLVNSNKLHLSEALVKDEVSSKSQVQSITHSLRPAPDSAASMKEEKQNKKRVKNNNFMSLFWLVIFLLCCVCDIFTIFHFFKGYKNQLSMEIKSILSESYAIQNFSRSSLAVAI